MGNKKEVKPTIAANKPNEEDHITTGELLEAIKHPAFNDDSMIYIHPLEDEPEPLGIVFRCNHCKDLHLVGGTEKASPSFNSQMEVFVNKLSCDDVSYVRRKELVAILEKLDKDIIVSMTRLYDKGQYLFIHSVIKCLDPKCSSIHFLCGYFADDPLPDKKINLN